MKNYKQYLFENKGSKNDSKNYNDSNKKKQKYYSNGLKNKNKFNGTKKNKTLG